MRKYFGEGKVANVLVSGRDERKTLARRQLPQNPVADARLPPSFSSTTREMCFSVQRRNIESDIHRILSDCAYTLDWNWRYTVQARVWGFLQR